MKRLSVDGNYELAVLLVQARDAVMKARRKELTRYHISPRQSAVLYYIQAIGAKATPAEISRGLFRESHSISEILGRMEKQGLLRRVKDLSRKNMVRVELTEKGREACNQSEKRASLDKIFSTLSKEERQQLRSYLERLRDKALRLIQKKRPLFP
jgi:DNA-binding MarR family transcriptional regulator